MWSDKSHFAVEMDVGGCEKKQVSASARMCLIPACPRSHRNARTTGALGACVHCAAVAWERNLEAHAKPLGECMALIMRSCMHCMNEFHGAALGRDGCRAYRAAFSAAVDCAADLSGSLVEKLCDALPQQGSHRVTHACSIITLKTLVLGNKTSMQLEAEVDCRCCFCEHGCPTSMKWMSCACALSRASVISESEFVACAQATPGGCHRCGPSAAILHSVCES